MGKSNGAAMKRETYEYECLTVDGLFSMDVKEN